jgi:hypothetical protein
MTARLNDSSFAFSCREGSQSEMYIWPTIFKYTECRKSHLALPSVLKR